MGELQQFGEDLAAGDAILCGTKAFSLRMQDGALNLLKHAQ